MTVDEFFEWQQHQDRNYELVDGVPVLTIKSMAGVSDIHDRITVNAIAWLHQRLRGKTCRPKTSDISVRTFRGTRRPDLLIECGRPDSRSTEAAIPKLVVEVLSPSTMRYGRFQKLEEYKLVPAIQVILLVDTEHPRAIVWRRVSETWTNHEVTGQEAYIDLPEIGTSLPLAELYFDVDFSQPQ